MSEALKSPWIKRTVMAALGIAPPPDANAVETQADSQFSAIEETQADVITAHDVLCSTGQVVQLTSVDCTGDCHRVELSDRHHEIVAYISGARDAIDIGQSSSSGAHGGASFVDEVPDTRTALVKRKGGLFVLDAFHVATERIALPGGHHMSAPRFCLVIDRMRYWGSAGNCVYGTPRALWSDDALALILANTPEKRLHEVLAHVQRPPWAARRDQEKALAPRRRGGAAPGGTVVLDAEAHRVPFDQHVLLKRVDGFAVDAPPSAAASSTPSASSAGAAAAPAAPPAAAPRAAAAAGVAAAAACSGVQTQGLAIARLLAKFKTSMSVPGKGLVRVSVGAGFAQPVAQIFAVDPAFCAEYSAVISTPMVSVLLFTVTFYANRAHNLTRSP